MLVQRISKLAISQLGLSPAVANGTITDYHHAEDYHNVSPNAITKQSLVENVLKMTQVLGSPTHSGAGTKV